MAEQTKTRLDEMAIVFWRNGKKVTAFIDNLCLVTPEYLMKIFQEAQAQLRTKTDETN